MLCQDDKHTVKVEEPGLPVAAVDRGKQVLVSKDQVLEVSDHDFTKFSLTPSVTLKVDIPETVEGSFHLGQMFVGLKENAFQPSSSLRHLSEFSSIEIVTNQLNAIITMVAPIIICSTSAINWRI